MVTALPSKEDVQTEKAERHLYDFTRQAWPIVEGEPMVDGWHIHAICEHLEAVTSGDIRNLIINVPYRHMKSLLVSVFWPAWEWIREPKRRFLTASYAGTLSTRDSVRSRWVIESDWYKKRWGDRFLLTTDQNVKSYYWNDKGGFRIAIGKGGAATGEGGDRILIDDPHNREEITSDTIRKSDAEWVDQTMSTRKNDPKTSATVIIMQRLHEEDLSGHLLAKGGWEHLCLPAEYEKARHCYTSIGWEDPRTEEGELLWPARFGPKEIEEAKVSLGSMGFAAQMNQNPAPAEGNTIKRTWFRFYKQIPGDLEEIIQSWDMTFKDHKHNDYVAGQVWGRRGGEHRAERYLLDRVNEHLNFPGTVAAIRTMSAKWPRALTKLVEDTANGPAVIASLTNEIPGLIGVSPQGSKEARLASVSPTIEAGNVYLPDPSSAPWVEDYIRQLITFPNGVHDDEVDATSQALLRWLRSAELYFA